MALSEKDVRGIAEYAKIALTDDELTQMTSYMNDAVQMLEPVLQYDLPDVEPTFHPIGSLSNVMGDDLREPCRSTSRSKTPAARATATSACRPFWERGRASNGAELRFPYRRPDRRGRFCRRLYRYRGGPGLPCRHRGARGRGPGIPAGGARACARGRCARGCRPCRRQAAAPACGRAASHQGQHEPRGHAHHLRFPHAWGLPERLHCHLRPAHARCRLPAHGQGQHGRVCLWQLHRELGVPPHQQPLGYRSRARRLLGRLRCRRRRGRGRALAGLGHWRLHSPAGVAVRRGGL